MTVVALLLTAVIAAIAVIHAYWAAGGLWPGNTEQELANTVVGIPRLTRMPPSWLTAFAAVVFAGLAAWPFVLAPIAVRIITPALPIAATLAVAAVFLGRGVTGYLPAWRRRHSAQPFATYDRLFYSPLCLVLGAGFAALAFPA
jgi:Protein of unknown function (DUF3995)